jgi:hypothetical protein
MTRNQLPALALLVLAACAPPAEPSQPALSPQYQVYQAKLRFDAALDPALAYAAQPRCSNELVVGCSDQLAVESLAHYAHKADAALDAAEAAVRASPTGGDYQVQLAVARSALAQINAMLAMEAR